MNSTDAARLSAALDKFKNPRGYPSQSPSVAAWALAGRVFALEPNPWNYTEFGLDLSEAQPHYWLMQSDGKGGFGRTRRGGTMGLEGRYVVSNRTGDKGWARRGRWMDESTFRIETQNLESAIVAEWTARFLEDGRLELRYTDGDGVALVMHGRAK